MLENAQNYSKPPAAVIPAAVIPAAVIPAAVIPVWCATRPFMQAAGRGRTPAWMYVEKSPYAA